MTKRVLGLVAACALVVAACGGGTSTSPPVHPGAQACKDFDGWYQAHRSDLTSGAYSPVLKKAAAQAHGGKLHLAIDRFLVANTIAAQTSGSTQATVKKQAQALALSVVNYCRSATTNT
jgi:hypothetical protein